MVSFLLSLSLLVGCLDSNERMQKQEDDLSLEGTLVHYEIKWIMINW